MLTMFIIRWRERDVWNCVTQAFRMSASDLVIKWNQGAAVQCSSDAKVTEFEILYRSKSSQATVALLTNDNTGKGLNVKLYRLRVTILNLIKYLVRFDMWRVKICKLCISIQRKIFVLFSRKSAFEGHSCTFGRLRLKGT